jgi:hypothetical protein
MVDIYVGTDNTHWVLHEKLLCSRSKFFSKIFWDNQKFTRSQHSGNKSFGFPEEDDEPFRMFVGWLYSDHVPVPEEENDLGNLFDLYLMGEKWAIANLVRDVLDTVRKWYRISNTYPGLRRVQYVYANTDAESPMRQLLVNSVARMLLLNDGIPAHWDKALRKNGQLAVDIIQAIQNWRIDDSNIPDARQEILRPEQDKMRVVENAEEQQTGVPISLSDTVVQQQERPSGSRLKQQPLNNGIMNDEGEQENEDDQPEEETLYETEPPEEGEQEQDEEQEQ